MTAVDVCDVVGDEVEMEMGDADGEAVGTIVLMTEVAGDVVTVE